MNSKSPVSTEDLNYIAQLIDSISLATKELDSALKKYDTDKVNLSKREIARFQQQIDKLLS